MLNFLLTDVLLDLVLVILLFVHNYVGRVFGLLEFISLGFGLIFYVLWITSRIQLGKSFSVAPKSHSLVTHGLYSKIRNPIYVFSSLCLLCAVLPSGSLLQYFLLLALVIVQVIRSAKEGAVLTRKFGKKYSDYKSQTWF